MHAGGPVKPIRFSPPSALALIFFILSSSAKGVSVGTFAAPAVGTAAGNDVVIGTPWVSG